MPAPDLFSWKERAPYPLPRAGCAAGVVDGKVILAGGTFWREGQKFWCDQVDAYDPQLDRWTAATPLPRAHGDAAAVTCDGRLFMIGGGAGGLPTAEVWSYGAGTWRLEPQMLLPAARRTAVAAELEGTIYLLGGLAGTGTDFASAAPTFWAAQPGQAWRVLAPMPGPVRFNTAVGGLAGRIIVTGGCTVEQGVIRNRDDILAYDPATNTWSHLGHLPVAIRGACGLVEAGRLLVIGGYTDKFETSILSVEPRTAAALSAGRLPHGLADTRFLTLGPRVIGVTGESGIKQRAPWTLEAAPTSP
jgi:N-acetylneuraminic acid mutarotase